MVVGGGAVLEEELGLRGVAMGGERAAGSGCRLAEVVEVRLGGVGQVRMEAGEEGMEGGAVQEGRGLGGVGKGMGGMVGGGVLREGRGLRGCMLICIRGRWGGRLVSVWARLVRIE